MSGWETYKGLEVPAGPFTPTNNAGEKLKEDLTGLADRSPYLSSNDPTANDDTSDGFFAGSQWFNSSTQVMWVCTDASAGAAVWRSLYKREAGGIVLSPSGDGDVQLGDDLDVNGRSIVSTSNGDIPISPNGAGQVVLDGLNWPAADGNTGEVLKTDGAAGLYFGAGGGGGGAFTADGSFAAYQGTDVDAGGGANLGSLAQGSYATASGSNGTFAQGYFVSATGRGGTLAQGYTAYASGDYGCFAQGVPVWSSGSSGCFAQGISVSATGHYGSFAQGQNAVATGYKGSFAQGGYNYVLASGDLGSFAQGDRATASGNFGAFAQGTYVTASGSYGCFAQGRAVTASANSAWAQGFHTTADKRGQFARATGRFASDGDAQLSILVARNQTTNGTPTDLFLNGSSERIAIPADKCWAFSVLVSALQTAGTGAGACAGYEFSGVIKNISGTTSLVGAVGKTVLGEDTAAWDANVTADNTNDALDISVTGETSKTIRWVAAVYLSEVG